MAGWNQTVRHLPAGDIDRYDRFGHTCAVGKCEGLPTHATAWDYRTGQRRRVSRMVREVCTKHAEKFAKQHGIEVAGTHERGPSFFAAAVGEMTGVAAPVDFVRVCRGRHGFQWYLERQRTRSASLFATTSQWLAGVPGDADLPDAVRAAERILCQDRLVPDGAWQAAGPEASVRVIPAEKSPKWGDKPWNLAVTRGPDGMWTLTRVLGPQFPPITDELGFHNMSIERALRVANTLLDEQGWLSAGLWTPGDTDPLTVTRLAWHPAQATIHPQGGNQ
jgi:hypothetical protein